MGFDARQAKALPAGDHIIVDDAPGLRLIATQTRKTWTYRYKSPVDGRMRQVAIGQWPAMPLGAAVAAWHDLRARRDAGEDPAKTKRAEAGVRVAKKESERSGPYRVADLITDYLDGHIARHRKAKGQAETRRLMTGDYTAAIWQLQPGEVTRRIAYDLLEGLATRAPVLANALRTELGAAWDQALDAGRISEDVPNWWRQILRGKLRSRGKIVKGKHEGRTFRTLTDQEMCVLLPWLPNFSRLEQDLLTMYLWTGARGAEIVGMRGDEVSEESDGWWLTVPREKLKMSRLDTAVDYRVPLVGRALEIVKRRVDLYGQGYLFPPNKTDAITPHVQQKVLGVALWAVRPSTVTDRLEKDRVKVLHLKPFAPHDLRRTVRTKLAALGCESATAEAIIGHMPSGIDGVYDRHTYDPERRIWLKRIADHWESLAAG